MAVDSLPVRRCAIYTRKSSEEGLEQGFNSLDAQYEACAAYIASQHHEGWTHCERRYDDGGTSGGTMDRPGLKRLLDDIEAGSIDIVIVYKVDRLTRSLGDFARMVDIFDRNAVSFVSITQQFNTTSSMGRLTLNVLLSFAQFEREVTGERIRDKIAASKKKGMWMGGNVPLGYNVVDRRLVVNPREAKTVRTLFHLYLEKRNVRETLDEAHRLGIVTKKRVTRSGKRLGGKPYARSPLYWLLKNPIYIGRIRHGDKSWPGQHDAIIDDANWDAVQALLDFNTKKRRNRTEARAPSLLAGILSDEEGRIYTPSHAVKNGRRYRYYVERALKADDELPHKRRKQRLPAHDIESVVIRAIAGTLRCAGKLFEILNLSPEPPTEIEKAVESAVSLADQLQNGALSDQVRVISNIVNRVSIGAASVKIDLDAIRLATELGLPETIGAAVTHRLEVPVSIKARGVEMKLIITDPAVKTVTNFDTALIKAIVRANEWWRRLITGEVESITEIAREEGCTQRLIARHLPLAFLDPMVARWILDGLQPPNLSLETLTKGAELPLSWVDQRQKLGFDRP